MPEIFLKSVETLSNLHYIINQVRLLLIEIAFNSISDLVSKDKMKLWR